MWDNADAPWQVCDSGWRSVFELISSSTARRSFVGVNRPVLCHSSFRDMTFSMIPCMVKRALHVLFCLLGWICGFAFAVTCGLYVSDMRFVSSQDGGFRPPNRTLPCLTFCWNE